MTLGAIDTELAERRRWISIPEAAERISAKPAVIYDWIRRGHLRPLRHGRRMLVHWDDVMDVDLGAQQRDMNGNAARRVDQRLSRCQHDVALVLLCPGNE